MFEFFSNLFARIVSVFQNLLLIVYSLLPEVPSVTVALDTFDLVTEAAVACRYFLPLDTIAVLTSATVGLFAFKIVVSFMRSEFGQMIIGIVLDKLKDLVGILLKFI